MSGWADNRDTSFRKDGVAHCAECDKVVDFQQGNTIRSISSAWLRMHVDGHCGHKWTIKLG